MRSVRKLIIVIGALAFAGAASATTMTVTCSTLNGPTELNGNVVCPQFSGLGLLSVAITVDGTVSGSITLTNNGTATQIAEGTTTSGFMVGPLTGFIIANPLFSATFNTGSQSLTAGQTRTFSGLSGSGFATITDNSLFAPYTGTGNFDIPVLTATMLNVTGGGGNIASSQSTTGRDCNCDIYFRQYRAGDRNADISSHRPGSDFARLVAASSPLSRSSIAG